MSKQTARGVELTEVSEEQVGDYLLSHPDFFERHANVLARLKLPHQRGSAAVSLVERQVLVLREKHATLERRLLELLENGRSNDVIVERTQKLARRLLRTTDLAGVFEALEGSLREDFGASRWVAIITHPGLPGINAVRAPQLRLVPRGSPELKIFESFLETARPRSGQIRDTQREYLFGDGSGPVGSTALLPLGERASLGLLAIASPDTERFLPTMSTDFLARIGELIGDALTTRGA